MKNILFCLLVIIVSFADDCHCQTAVSSTSVRDDVMSITPEMFGCKGDSITDDTENLQKAIDYCRENQCMLRSSKGKIYAISSPLHIKNPGEMQVDFGGAELKAVKEMEYMLGYDNMEDFTTGHNNVINNLLLDCNHLSGGIRCFAAIKTSFNFIMIRNCIKRAFEVLDGYEVFLTNSHIKCDSDRDSYGIYTKTGDSHYDNIVIIDAHTAVYQNCAPVVFYDKIHAWLFNNVEGSTFFWVAGGLAMLNQCYCDTAEKGYYMPTFATIKIMNSQYYNNPECYDSPNNPVLFAFGSEELAKSANVSCISSCFNSGGLKAELCNYPAQRIQFAQCFIDPSIKGNFGEFKIEPSDIVRLNRAFGEIADNNMDFMCPEKDKRNHLFIDAEVVGSYGNKELLNVGTVEKEYAPTKDAYGVCAVVWNDGQFSQGTVKVSKDNGSVLVNPGSSKGKHVKQIVIDMNYMY